jgi:outer membrane protein assembly factor BamA
MPETRAAEIESQRRQKAAHLEPEEQARIEHKLQVVEDDDLIQRIFGGIPGPRLVLGALITGSGFAIGPGYEKPLLNNQMDFRASLHGSTHKYYLMDADLSMPKLASDHYFLDLYASRLEYAAMNYYGQGPDSHKTGRSDYRLQETGFQATTGFKLWRYLRAGGIGRYLLAGIGPGNRDEYATTESLYSGTAPGILAPSHFFQDGGFLQFDYRDTPGDPHSGGNYSAQYSTFNDVDRGHYSFDRLDLEAQQYIPFFNKLRVIALRAKVIATSPHQGNEVPFYLQPTLGGPDDLRGYRAFRFYDNNMAVLNGEYRWQVFTGLDMALFVDGGQVFDRWEQINYRSLRADAGFGFRFKMNNAVFMRIDTGFSPEGFGIWFKFGNIF